MKLRSKDLGNKYCTQLNQFTNLQAWVKFIKISNYVTLAPMLHSRPDGRTHVEQCVPANTQRRRVILAKLFYTSIAIILITFSILQQLSGVQYTEVMFSGLHPSPWYGSHLRLCRAREVLKIELIWQATSFTSKHIISTFIQNNTNVQLEAYLPIAQLFHSFLPSNVPILNFAFHRPLHSSSPRHPQNESWNSKTRYYGSLIGRSLVLHDPPARLARKNHWPTKKLQQ